MDLLPHDVLCYLLSFMSSWKAIELLELRLVSRKFLRAADSPFVSRHWRERNGEYLQWLGRTLRFQPTFDDDRCCRLFLADLFLCLSWRRDGMTVSYASAVWLHYAAMLSVANIGTRKILRTEIKHWIEERADPPLFLNEVVIPEDADDDDSSEYVPQESVSEEEHQEELEADEELISTTTDAIFGWDYDAELRNALMLDEEDMPSSWNYLHWSFSHLPGTRAEAAFESVSHVYTDAEREMQDCLQSCPQLVNERCVVTGRSPLLVCIAQAGTDQDLVLTYCKWLKAAGADFSVQDNLNRSVMETLLHHSPLDLDGLKRDAHLFEWLATSQGHLFQGNAFFSPNGSFRCGPVIVPGGEGREAVTGRMSAALSTSELNLIRNRVKRALTDEQLHEIYRKNLNYLVELSVVFAEHCRSRHLREEHVLHAIGMFLIPPENE